MQFGEWSPGGQEMVTSGGEGKKCRSQTHDRFVLNICTMRKKCK